MVVDGKMCFPKLWTDLKEGRFFELLEEYAINKVGTELKR